MSKQLSSADRARARSVLMASLNKKHPGIIVDPNNIPEVEVISTGSYKLDALLRVGRTCSW